MSRPPALLLSTLSLCLGSALLLTGCSGEQEAAAGDEVTFSASPSPGTQAPDGSGGGLEPVGTTTEEGYTVVSEPEILPGDEVPRPTGKVVLTLQDVPTTNVGDELRFDLATLERLGVVEYEVFDRQAEGRDVTFSGPLLRDVLAVAGADGRTLKTRALNDYAVDVPVSDAAELPVLLATRSDGEKMSVANYGPTRLIYPTEGFDLDQTVYDPRWAWQLATIRVA